MRLHGTVENVTQTTLGTQLATDAHIGDTTLSVVDGSDFNENPDGSGGGTLLLGGVTAVYTNIDNTANVITLASTLTVNASAGDRVDVYDPSTGAAALDTLAHVALAGARTSDDYVEATVRQALVSTLDVGDRAPGSGEACVIEDDEHGDGQWDLVDIRGKKPQASATSWPKHHTTHELGGTDQVAVSVGQINATGSPSSTTYLRGDGAWAAAGSSSPVIGCYIPPSGIVYESYPRQLGSASVTTLATGKLTLCAVYLPAGVTISTLAAWFLTAIGSPTHWWFGLYDNNRVQLATTADQTSTPSGTGVVSLAIATVAGGAASSFTTTYSGLHYIGVMVAATGVPSQLVYPSEGVGVMSAVPVVTGTSDTGQTIPPAFPHTAAAITALANLPWCGAG